ncbi:hypothetical protein JCM8202v2_001783 [Rhodotorula sphaerocarpa]
MPLPRASIPIPSPLAAFYAKFPLVELPGPTDTAGTLPPQTPFRAKIWALGPPPAGHAESLDPLCRAAQAYARFAFGGAETRWLAWENRNSSPEGQLPALHTPNGDLLTGEELDAWIASHLTSKNALLPALLAALYLSPATVGPAVVPDAARPFLSQLAHVYLSWNDRSTRIEEIKRLRGGKSSPAVPLDLEHVEREAVEAIEALEVKMQAASGAKWFDGASGPARFDALLYAILSIVRILPRACDDALRPALERSPALSAWVKQHEP